MNVTSKTLGKWLVSGLGAAFAVFILFLLYKDLDFQKLWALLETAGTGWILILCAAILLEQFCQGWKWQQVLFDLRPVSSIRLTGAILAGYGANALVPLGVSPLVRSWLVARLEGLKMSAVLMTTAISRFVDGVVFALLAAVLVVIFPTPKTEGDLSIAMTIGVGFNLVLFGGLLWLIFILPARLEKKDHLLNRILDWLGKRFKIPAGDLGQGLRQGILWPKSKFRQVAVILIALLMKLVAASHFAWAGLSVGIILEPLDYLFLMIFAGFVMVLGRFIRIPGGFVLGSAFALKLLDVPDEEAITMILLSHMLSMILIVGLGLLILWKKGIDLHEMRKESLQES